MLLEEKEEAREREGEERREGKREWGRGRARALHFPRSCACCRGRLRLQVLIPALMGLGNISGAQGKAWKVPSLSSCGSVLGVEAG